MDAGNLSVCEEIAGDFSTENKGHSDCVIGEREFYCGFGKVEVSGVPCET